MRFEVTYASFIFLFLNIEIAIQLHTRQETLHANVVDYMCEHPSGLHAALTNKKHHTYTHHSNTQCDGYLYL